MPIARIATLEILPGSNKDFEAVLFNLIKAMKADEPGAIQHILHKSGESQYILYELYESEAAMRAHSQTVHFNMIGIQIASYVVSSAIKIAEPILFMLPV